MEGLYFEYLPTELITVLVSKLDVSSLEYFRDIYKDINWRDIYQLRYPYFVEGYNKIKKCSVKPFDYQGYHDVLTLDETSDHTELGALYNCIERNLVEYGTFKFDFSTVQRIIDTKDVVMFNHFWDVVQLISQIYVGRLYPMIYDKFNKYDFDAYDCVSINNDLYNIQKSNDDGMILNVKRYILTGKWNIDYVITWDDYREFEEFHNPDESNDHYTILVIMVCIFLEDNVKLGPRDNHDIVTRVIRDILSMYYSMGDRVYKLLAPIYHLDETVFEIPKFSCDLI